jgi:hypothetical protein
MAILTAFLIFGVLVKMIFSIPVIASTEFQNCFGGPYFSMNEAIPESYMFVAIVIGYFFLRHLKKEEIMFRKDPTDLIRELVSQIHSKK